MEAVWQLFSRGASVPEALPAFEALTDPADFEALADRLMTLDDPRRLRALEVLERARNPELLSTLIAFYEDPLDEVRERSLVALERLGGDPLSEQVVGDILLEDPVPAVRLAAARALSATGTAGARGFLSEALGDPDPGVRQSIERLLAGD